MEKLLFPGGSLNGSVLDTLKHTDNKHASEKKQEDTTSIRLELDRIVLALDSLRERVYLLTATVSGSLEGVTVKNRITHPDIPIANDAAMHRATKDLANDDTLPNVVAHLRGVQTRLSVLESVFHLAPPTEPQYADHLSAQGSYIRDTLNSYPARPRPPAPLVVALSTNLPILPLLVPQATTVSVPPSSVETPDMQVLTKPKVSNEDGLALDLTLHHVPTFPDLYAPLAADLVHYKLETDCLQANELYGLFLGFRQISLVSQKEARVGTIHTFPNLPDRHANIAETNKVLLLERRYDSKKTIIVGNAFKRARFESLVVPEDTLDTKDNPDALNKSRTTKEWFLEEQTPVQVIREKTYPWLMTYDTTFAPTKKRLLKVAHVTVSLHRKYNLVCPIGYWPVYEIWRMTGPNPWTDRAEMVYRSAESPVVMVTLPKTVVTQDQGNEEIFKYEE